MPTKEEEDLYLTKSELERLESIDYKNVPLGICDLKFTSGTGRDLCRLIWRKVNNDR